MAYQNVADEAISAGDSADFIISQMKAFNIEAEDSLHIIDAVNQVSNSYAVSSADLATNIGKASSALAIGGVTFEQTLGLMTAITEINRSGAKTSRSLVTIQSRYNQILDETSSTGQKLIEFYDKHNIQLYDQEGQLRSLWETLSDVADIWNTLDENEQKYFLNIQAGANQSTQLGALMLNFQTAVDATNTALNSSGSAMKENEAYMESLEAKTNLLAADFQNLSNDVISKDLIASVLDLGSALLKLADSDIGQVVTKLGLLAGIVGSGSALLGATKIIPALVGSLAPLGGAFTTAATGAVAFNTALKASAPLIGLAVAAIAGLVLGIKAIDEALDPVNQAKKALEELDNIQSEIASNDRIIELANKYDTLRESIESGKLSEEEMQAASAELDSVRAELASVTDGLVDSELEYGEVLDGNVAKAREAAEAEKERLNARVYQWVDDNEAKYAKAVNKSIELTEKQHTTEKALAIARENYGADATQLYNDLVTHVNEWRDAAKSGASNAEELYAGVRTELYALTGVLADADSSTGDFWETFSRLVPEAINTTTVVGNLNGALQQTKLELDPLNSLINEFQGKVIGLFVDGIIGADEALNMFNVNGEQTVTRTQMMNVAFEQLLPKIKDGSMSYAEAAEKLGWYEEDVRHMVQAMQEVPGATQAFTNSINNQVDALLSLEDELATAQVKIAEFQSKMEGGEKGDTLKSYASIYSQFLEAYEQGLVGSNVYKAAIETFFSPEFLEGFAGDYRAAGEVLGSEFFQAIFAEGGEDYGANLLAILSDYGEVVETAGGKVREVKNDQGDLIASFAETENGLYPLTVDFKKLGEMIGLDQSVMDAFADALSAYGMEIGASAEEVWDFAESLNAISTNAEGITTLDLGQVIGEISSSSVDNINEVVNKMHELEGIDLTTVDLAGIIESMAEAGKSASEIKAVTDNLLEMDGITLTNVQGSVDHMIEKFLGAQGEADNTKADIKEVDDSTAEPEITANTSGFDTAYQTVMAKIQELNNTPAVIKIITQKSTDEQATGTDYAPGGPTLVNEEGPEIIVESGKARIAGGGEPTITEIERGATVYNATDTEKILKNGLFDGEINAFATGTGGFIPWSATTSGAPERTGGSTGASGGSSTPISTAYSSGYSDGYYAATEDYEPIVASSGYALDEEVVKAHQTTISLLEAEYDLLEKQNASREELEAKANEIQAAYHAENEYIRGSSEYLSGDEETLKSVVDNSAKWYDWQSKIYDALVESSDLYTKTQEYISGAVDLLDKQNGSKEEQVKLARDYQKNLHAEAERLRGVLARANEIGMTEEEILETQTKINSLSAEWWDWQDKIYEIVSKTSKAYDSIVNNFQAEYDFLEAQDDTSSIERRLELLGLQQDKLHEQAEEYRKQLSHAKELGLTEDQIRDLNTEILKLSKEWWEIEEKKLSTILKEGKAYEKLQSYIQSEYNFLEASGSDKLGGQRIKLLTQEQDLLHERNEYLRQILAMAKELKLTDEEILAIEQELNANSKQWWENEEKKKNLLKDSIESEYNVRKEAIEALANQMQEYYQGQIDALDEQIDALKNVNEVLEDQVELEEKLDAIAQARAKKVMVYKDGRWQYVSDIDAVSTASAAYEEYMRKKKLNEAIAELEKQKEAIEETKSAWSKFGSDYDKIQQKWLINQQLGFNTSLDNWQSYVEGVEIWAQRYMDTMSMLTTVSDPSEYVDYNTMVAAVGTANEANGSETKLDSSTIYNIYWSQESKDKDYAQAILDARSWAEAQTWASQREIKMAALGLTDADVGSTQEFLDRFREKYETAESLGAVSSTGVIDKNYVADQSYASGTLSASGGLSLVGEQGAELRVLGQGDGILPAGVTRNLMSWGSVSPYSYASQVANNLNNKTMDVTIQSLSLPNVTDGNGFVEYVKNNMFGQVMQFVH